MSIEQWLEQYGYLAVFFGVFFEGPITLTLAGFLAHQGYFDIFFVLITAFVATFLVVEILYFAGLVAGQRLLALRPAWREKYTRFSGLISRYRFFILCFRFIYGSQVVSSLASGIGKIRPAYFSAMNAAGAALWTFVFFLVGYFFGHGFEMLIEDIKRHEILFALVLAALVLIYYFARRIVWRRISKGGEKASMQK